MSRARKQEKLVKKINIGMTVSLAGLPTTIVSLYYPKKWRKILINFISRADSAADK